MINSVGSLHFTGGTKNLEILDKAAYQIPQSIIQSMRPTAEVKERGLKNAISKFVNFLNLKTLDNAAFEIPLKIIKTIKK